MLGRLFVVGGVAWLAALVLFAALLQWSARQPLPLTPAQQASSALVLALTHASQSPQAWPEWVVTKATSAHDVIVVDVDAEHPEQAQAIAAEIVGPIHSRYDEVLVYVQSVDHAKNPHVRRIQWTPRVGYVETDFRNDR